MRILKIVGGVIAALIVLLVVIGFLLPSQVHVERSVTVNAPACTAYTLLNGFGRFNEFSPWAKLDDKAVYTFEGPATGVGAILSWKSDNKNVGVGSQEIVESVPCEKVTTQLRFEGEEPFLAPWTIKPVEGGVSVTWGMDADMGANPVKRYVGLMMDSMLGTVFEQGLADFKTLAETMPKTDFAGLNAEVVDMTPNPMVYVSTQAPRDPQAVGVAMGTAFGQLQMYMTMSGLTASGPPLAINTAEGADVYIFDVGIPVTGSPVADAGPVKVGNTPGGKAVRAIAKGPYSALSTTYEQMLAYIAVRGLKQNGPSWEVYVSDPTTTPKDEVVTQVYYPVE